jgi:hypothetical protein
MFLNYIYIYIYVGQLILGAKEVNGINILCIVDGKYIK